MVKSVLNKFIDDIAQADKRLEVMKKIGHKIEKLEYEIEKLKQLSDPGLIMNGFIITSSLTHQVESFNYTEGYSIPQHHKSKILTLLNEVLLEKQEALNNLERKLINFENMSLVELAEISDNL